MDFLSVPARYCTPTSNTDTGKFADYPTLGIDAQALYIGVNLFGTRGQGSFANTTGFVVRKSSLLSGGPIVVTAFRQLVSSNPNAGGPYTPQGVDNFDPNATEGYFIGVDSSYYGRLRLRRVSNPGGSPTLSESINITVPITGNTINVPHLGNTNGTSGYLDGLDYRLLAAHIRNGRLWTAANIAVDNAGSPSGTDTRMGVRWYELGGIATGQTPTVIQSGTFFQPSASNTSDQRHYWMGSVMVSGQGHALIGVSASGANEYANAAYAYRIASDPAGSFRTPVIYTSSSFPYNPPSNPGGAGGRRWGDYSYTSVDPSDDMTMWTVQEWCNGPGIYAVQVAKVLAPPPATLLSASPSVLTNGHSNVSVTVLGQTVDGSGFFDPGLGFSNRLSAAVSGTGVSVTSLTYNNPTNVTLTLQVSGSAIPGPRVLAITNPDGQVSASSSGFVTIVGGPAANQSPVLAAITNRTAPELSMLVVAASASDPDGNILAYSLDQGAPSGASIHPTAGVFQWTPSEAQGPSTNQIRIIVTDNGTPSLSATQAFTVVVTEVNVSPMFAATPPTFTTPELVEVIVTNSVTDSDLPPNDLTYTLMSGPANAVISGAGVITWTPSEAQGPGSAEFFARVSDGTVSITNSFSVNVTEVNVAPEIGSVPNWTVHAGSVVVFTNRASDADLPSNILIFSLGQGAPASANVSPETGVFAWATADSDEGSTNSITIQVSDDAVLPLAATSSFSVAVVERPRILGIAHANGLVQIEWEALAGVSYLLQRSPSLSPPAWQDAGGPVAAGGPTASQTNNPAGSDVFYRVRIVP